MSVVGVPTPARAAIPAAERQALIDLYDATHGASWSQRTGWLGGEGSECSWFGVACDAGHTTVRQLNLNSNNLVGTLPASLGTLATLREIHLSSNQLAGAIPTWLGSLASLQWLDLSDNQLAGSIPSWLGTVTSLQRLDLSHNQLTGPITDLGGLQNLLDLGLGENPSTPAHFRRGSRQ